MNERNTSRLRLRTVLAVAFFAGILLVGSIIMLSKTSTAPKSETASIQLPAEDYFQDADFERDGKWYGLCNKNSIQSIEDFRRTVSEDPALRNHYAAFNWDKAQMGKLQQPMLAYVYFKKDGQIFRKEKPIKLPAGDTYISDGKTTVRTYCCNNYVASAALPPDQAESQAAATTVAPSPSSPAVTPPVEVAASGSTGNTGLAGGFIGFTRSSSDDGYYPPGNPPTPNPNYSDSAAPIHVNPVPVPEPGTGLLVAIGMAVSLAVLVVSRFSHGSTRRTEIR